MNENQRSIIWGFVDGSISISGSMLLAVLISHCQSCGEIWPLAFLQELSEKNTGLVVVATLLLFPTAVAVYGGLKMWFAAKEAVEKKAMAKGRAEALQGERERVRQMLTQELAQLGISVPEESITRILTGQPAAPPQTPPPPRPYRRRSRRNGNGNGK